MLEIKTNKQTKMTATVGLGVPDLKTHSSVMSRVMNAIKMEGHIKKTRCWNE